MASYLCVKMNSSATKSYNIKSSANKPYLRVDTGFIPLTTATATGPKLMVRAGGVNYRLADFITTTTAITTGTSYLTSAKTTSTSYVTGSRASTSGTGYQTRMSTSATTYYTRMSTSATTYATRASTSKTDYAYKTNTTNTIYSGRFFQKANGQTSASTSVANITGKTYVGTNTYVSKQGLVYNTSISHSQSNTYTRESSTSTTYRRTYSTRSTYTTISITNSIYRKLQYIYNNQYFNTRGNASNSVYFTVNGTSFSTSLRDTGDHDTTNSYVILEDKTAYTSSILNIGSFTAMTNSIRLGQSLSTNYRIEFKSLYSTSANNNLNFDLQINYKGSVYDTRSASYVTSAASHNYENIPTNWGTYISTGLNGNIVRNTTYTTSYAIDGVRATQYYNTANSITYALSEQIFKFKNYNLTSISNNFYRGNALMNFHGLYSTSTIASTFALYDNNTWSYYSTATCSKVTSSIRYSIASVKYGITTYGYTHSSTSYQTNRSVTNTIYSTRSSTSNTGYKTRSSTSATSYLTRSSTSNTTYATRSSQYTSNTSYLTQSETYETSYITASTETTMEG